MTRASSAPAGPARRARIVLLAAQGLPNAEIGRLVGVSLPTVRGWRARYVAGGLAALHDRSRSGRPPEYDEAEILVTTLAAPPTALGAAHWSARRLGTHLGIPFGTVARIWRAWDLDPRRVDTFAFPTEPELGSAVVGLVAVYLRPPDLAAVLATPTPEVASEESTALLSALQAATGGSANRRSAGHARRTLLSFLQQVTKAYPQSELHVVAGTDSVHAVPPTTHPAHTRPKAAAWLAANPGVKVHVARSPGSWLTLLEVFLANGTGQARGSGGTSAKDVAATIVALRDGWTDRRDAFIWVKTARRGRATSRANAHPCG